MTCTYAPPAGTVPARALAYLLDLPADTIIANGPLADALGMDPNTLNASLGTLVKHQLLLRDKREGRLHWRLGPNASARATPPMDDEKLDAVPDLAVKQVRVDASAAPTPIAGLTRQSWCPAAQDSGDASSLDEPPAPPPSPAPPGPNWPFPRAPVFLASAAAEPGPADSLTVAPGVLSAEDDPDFREVERAPAAEVAELPKSESSTPARDASEFRCALWSSGELHIEVYPGNFLLLTKDETRQLVAYLERMAETTE